MQKAMPIQTKTFDSIAWFMVKPSFSLIRTLSLSQTYDDWRTAANRMKLLFDDRALQTETDRIVPIASFAGTRDPDASPPAQYPATQITETADPCQHRPPCVYRTIWLGS